MDSSVLTAYTRGREAALEYIEAHGDGVLYLPTIALYETYYGALRVEADLSIEELRAAFG